MSRERDDDRPLVMALDVGPTTKPGEIPPPRPVALWCLLCSPPCESCPLAQPDGEV